MGPVSESEDITIMEFRQNGDGMESPVYTIEETPKDHSQNGFTNLAYVSHSQTDDTDNNYAIPDKYAGEKSGKSDTGTGNTDEFKSLVPFCIMFGIGSLFSSSLNTFLSSQITVIERSFNLSSSKSGLLLSANDVGFVAAVLFTSHFLKNKHIPRILGICVLTFGLAGLLTSLPHFITNEKMPTHHSNIATTNTSKTNDLLCHPHSVLSTNNTGGKCESKTQEETNQKESENTKAMIVLGIIGVLMLIQGVAKAPRQALSSVYIDNNSEKTKTGFYLGLLMSFTIFGPFIAILAGGLLNKIPVDLQETTLQVHDPRWVGAWWLGFIIFGACAVVTSLPLFCFPASMRIQRPEEDDRKAEYVNTPQPETENTSFCYMIKDIPKSVLRVFMSPVYVANLLSLLMTMFAIMVLGTFGPKYIENQFHIPTYKANIVLGLEKLGTTVIGTFFGGVVTRRLKLGLLGCIKMLFVSRVLSSIIHSSLLFLGCDRPEIVGYDVTSGFAANLSCDCTNADYLPVCGDGQTFFSPCHAGCLVEESSGYSNCTGSVSGFVEPGICDDGCNLLYPFIAVNALTSLVGTAGISPAYVVMLRSIQPTDRAMALGLQSFLLSLLVFLPAPIILGKLFDNFCLVWKDSCGGKGACSLYDNAEMRYQLLSIDIGLKIGCVICTIIAFLFARRWAMKEAEDKNVELEVKSNKPPIPQPRLSLQSDSRE